MKMNKLFVNFARALVLCAAAAAAAAAQNSAFTYQGKLNENGAPAAAAYDMKFSLYDAPAAGTQIGATETKTNVQTAGGVFSVSLDFTAAPLDGSPLWLEIAISAAGQNSFVTLAPRQKLTSVPYAVQALKSTIAANASNAQQLGGAPAADFVQTTDARMSDARAPLAGSGDYVQNTTTAQAGANFNVGGTGRAGVLEAATQFNLGGTRILSRTGTENLFVGGLAGSVNTGTSNTFVGAASGADNTSGFANSFFGGRSGESNTTGGNNAFFGYTSGSANTTGVANSFYGTSSGSLNTTGGSNAFFGFAAGQRNATGSSNAFFGSSAGRDSTSTNNSFFGAASGILTSTGNHNSFFGNAVGLQNTTGSTNHFFGSFAGRYNTTGSNNIFIGYQTGNVDAATQVSNSIAIGQGVTVATSNTIALGTNAQTTMIPGRVVMHAGSTNPNSSYGIAATFSGGFSGLIASNLVFRRLGSDILASPAHLCFRAGVGIGNGDGGYGVTNCTTAFSSAANKTDVQPFAGGIEIIKRLNPVAFKWKADGAFDVGLNAEDVAEIAPQFVTRSSEGKIEDLRENSLDVLFINAFKQQQKQIEAQQKQIEELKKLVCAANAQAPICGERK